MTRQYEAVYVFDSALDEGAINKHLDRFHALLKSKENPEPIKDMNHWGKRTLAYPIKGKEVGYYVVVQFATDPTLLPEFERLVKLEDSAIRYQLILNEGELPAPVPYPAPGDDEKPRERTGDADSSRAAAAAPAPPAADEGDE
ncbi:MAG: 30S ribosomal protein S6 [Gemmatimonadetes bacterium]|nr:30S ribosomal protein S6 [Gemmatimonadota bacterium]